ncbi:DsbA family protein [Priestia megaterium]|jgi:predicted DsbA family dithiol-disulfide isomerase|uniref:DsbA family oxidoreductase n=1 Tax=Priestia TaxID=2800373 RepID=UPI000BECB785|nr:DsbA family protein [Priestia megaterium]MED3853147.1 DsbA family protein [Priestia megaterium]MED3973583.1 DsbA family protein [Priestia megaterium]MED4796087.1 DsbA family protein [Priestia megaterium]PEB65583.1 disulfide bond formation protein DsbA [Priestia megaterium]PEE78382.1 disulfide bond formation protein DsbA [Priestia megaterium]
MKAHIEFYFDFVCPLCFLATKPLREVTKEQKAEIEWKPFELCPEPADQIEQIEDFLERPWNQSIAPLAQQLHVEINMPDMSPVPRTHLAHEGFHFAKKHGQESAYVDAVFKAYWEDEKDISQIEVLAEIADSLHLDKEIFTRILKDRTFEQVHKDSLVHAYEDAHVTKVPTLKIGSRVLQGFASKETIEKALLHERSTKDREK